jgi:hypothetical protein
LFNSNRSWPSNITLAAKNVGMQRSNFSALMKKHRLNVVKSKMSSSESPGQ